jgi:hypothetical protein
MMPKVGREWDELPCPSCGALNVVIVGNNQQIPSRCRACGKDVVFLYRPDAMPWTMKNGRKDCKGIQ